MTPKRRKAKTHLSRPAGQARAGSPVTAKIPTLAKNARMGHPARWGNRKGEKGGSETRPYEEPIGRSAIPGKAGTACRAHTKRYKIRTLEEHECGTRTQTEKGEDPPVPPSRQVPGGVTGNRENPHPCKERKDGAPGKARRAGRRPAPTKSRSGDRRSQEKRARHAVPLRRGTKSAPLKSVRMRHPERQKEQNLRKSSVAEEEDYVE